MVTTAEHRRTPLTSVAVMLVIFTPGLDRFDYFRTLTAIQAGTLPPERLAEIAPDFDTFFRPSQAWETARAR